MDRALVLAHAPLGPHPRARSRGPDARAARKVVPPRHRGPTIPRTQQRKETRSPALIGARGLDKRFGKVKALQNLDLVLPSGEPVAILGPNGAGKTTFVRMVATLLRPDSGALQVAGHDVRMNPWPSDVYRLAGQSAPVEEMMTGRENLVMVARLYGQTAARPDPAPPGSSARSPEDGPTVWSAPIPAACAASWISRPAGWLPPLCCWTSPRPAWIPEPQRGVGQHPSHGPRRHGHCAHHSIPGRGGPPGGSIVIIDEGRVIAQGIPDELKSQVGADVVELHTARRRHHDPAAPSSTPSTSENRRPTRPPDGARSRHRAARGSAGHRPSP